MNKRALMLTAATAALMSGPAYASCPSTPPSWTSITTEIQTYVDTACANKGAPSSITITTTGEVVLSTNPFTTPAVTVDSGTVKTPNTVFNAGTISYQGVTDAVGVQLTANGSVGGIDNQDLGIINLLGDGDGKTGILVGLPTGATTGTFTGGVVPTAAITGIPTFFNADKIAVLLETGSTVEVQGTTSYGIQTEAGTTLNGDIDIGGTIALTPTSTSSTSTDSNYGIYLGGTMNGSLIILPGGSVTSTGAGSAGVGVASAMTGSIVNYGAIEAIGIASPNTAANANNPQAGPALYVGASVTGGILNAGPTSTTDTTAAATITTEGNVPAVDITTAVAALSPTSVTIGTYADTNDPDFPGSYSIINRGTISAAGANPNVNVEAVAIVGSSQSVTVKLDGGIFDSGQIEASAPNNDDGAATSATALLISNFAQVPKLVTNHAESGGGVISASAGGPFGGTAVAVEVGSSGQLSEIDNAGTIEASATTTVLTISSLQADAILDNSGENAAGTASGTITTIDNSGTISAATTLLDNDRQIARAIDLTASTQNVTVTNTGTIVGDIVLGVGTNSLSDGSLNAQTASITGNVYFGGNPKKNDTLTIYDNAKLTGAVLEGAAGRVDVDVQGGGILDLQNSTVPLNSPILNPSNTTPAPLLAGTFTVENAGALQLAVSQPFNIYGINASTGLQNAAVPAIIEADSASLATHSIVQLSFGSFVGSPTGKSVAFDLISTPLGDLIIPPSQLTTMAEQVQGEIPFLFQASSSLCTQNVTGSPIPCATTIGNPAGLSELNLVLVPKVPGAGTAANPGLGLTGYALQLFPYANAALATDDTLGAGVVNAVTNKTTAQSIYSAFAPDVSGATRATAISLTDSASNAVAGRQRALRMYANQEGDTTLWGQQFVERLSQDSTPGTLGYNDTGFGFALGMDSGDPVSGRYGGAFTFFSGNAVEKDPVDVRTGSAYYLGTFYTDWRGKGLFLDTQWTAGWGQLRGQRSICACNTIDSNEDVQRTASGDRPTQMLAGSVTTGAIFNFGGTVITPQFDVDGLTMREDGYTEGGGQNINGGDGFDLRMQPYYSDSARTFLGVDLRQDIGFGDFYLQPEVRGGYRYDFLDGAQKLTANFVGVTPIDQFSITGPEPSKGNIVATGGLAVTTGAWSIGVSYDYMRANSGNTQQDGMITLLGRI